MRPSQGFLLTSRAINTTSRVIRNLGLFIVQHNVAVCKPAWRVRAVGPVIATLNRFRYYVYSRSSTLIIGTYLILNRQCWYCTAVSATHLLDSDLYRRLKLHEQATYVCNHISENFCAHFKMLANVLDITVTLLRNEYSYIYRQELSCKTADIGLLLCVVDLQQYNTDSVIDFWNFKYAVVMTTEFRYLYLCQSLTVKLIVGYDVMQVAV
jgi:hypothetical protein